MKKLLVLLIILSVFCTYTVTKSDEKTIIIYASSEQFRNDELQRQLNEQFPDLNIKVVYVSTAKSAAKVSALGTGVDADIIVGLEVSYMEKIKEYLAPNDGYSKIDFLDELEYDDSKYVAWERYAGSFIVNLDIIEKHNLPIPETYEDLLNPIYKNYIAMPDPNTSGTGFIFYKNLVNELGEEAAIEYFDKLQENIKSFTESGSGPVKLLKQGEIAIGLGMTFQAVQEYNLGYNFKIIEPEYGSPFCMTGTGLISGRENNEQIVEVYKYIVNDFLIYDKENFCPEKIYKGQINNIKNYPENIKYGDMTGIESIIEKERLLDLWKY